MLQAYDIIVVGAGHAGCEAAVTAANLGSKTLLITMDMNKIAEMSCNPAIGGIAKGQIVREIDAMGGKMGIASDASSIQFRMLNKTKGPAMWSPRIQSDRLLFHRKWRQIIEQTENLDIWQDTVTELCISKNREVTGVITLHGIKIQSKVVILTNGTFLNGLIHIGKTQIQGGRMGESSSYVLSDQLKDLGFSVLRMKTGTPLRIDGRTIDFSKCKEQAGDTDIRSFSFLPNTLANLPQLSCWITYTNTEVHDILNSAIADSPLYNGTIQSLGPRYCPSIETKLQTFAGKDQHQLFIEPESLYTNEFYLNGFSSSLPAHIQYKALKKVPGLENCKIYRPGYAIEYDYFDPLQLESSLQTKLVSNLFFAGQVNGTTGYEEAGAQGLIAGINAHFKITNQEPLVLNRDQAYIGVLIDDLVTKGVNEPYRMFTSRAEYRILLRQDNADIRLTPIGRKIGLVDDYRQKILDEKYNAISKISEYISKTSILPEQANPILSSHNSSAIKQSVKLQSLISRPEISINDFVIPSDLLEANETEKHILLEIAEIIVKYSGYIEKEKQLADKLSRLDYIKIKGKIPYETLKSLSIEARQKLEEIQPETIGQASRISGISPADISVLLIYLGR
ncbi:MAG: tRNA uridine-5-carboxymethylaminomethyl(34) synthesis enzyme MnmG [Bacteroidales bacterium]|jgi:tRNA uridine 5-carboxymethylaminomethyl modification enzyme|nr:tRNA uridine-5-carboxymethylaminomethyl(34) synthesis enzyme MnmG [Bacteroidales bacterium]